MSSSISPSVSPSESPSASPSASVSPSSPDDVIYLVNTGKYCKKISGRNYIQLISENRPPNHSPFQTKQLS